MGGIHPLTATRQRIHWDLERLDSTLPKDRKIEGRLHQIFHCLDFPWKHPAREMQDNIFHRKKSWYRLRTAHFFSSGTSDENQKPPSDASHLVEFIEMKAISARAHWYFPSSPKGSTSMKCRIRWFWKTHFSVRKEMFGKENKLRFRPSYFPFTEPECRDRHHLSWSAVAKRLQCLQRQWLG